jgi:c-di-GMP-binding flagellar brake protein YcgR
MNNSSEGAERRKFKRFVFAADDEVYGEFKLPGLYDAPTRFKIADISAGGLRVIVPIETATVVREGHLIFINQILGRSRLELVARVGLKVRWVLSHDALAHAMLGCEFIELSDENRDQIDAFVTSELERVTDNR